MSVIEIKDLKYRYPNTDRLALDGINLTVEKGEFIGIIGANGAGKSTLSQALLGLVPQFYNGAYGGSVLIEGAPAETTPVSELCCKVGLVFQNPFNQLSGAKESVYDEAAFGMENLGIPQDEMKKRLEHVLEELGIWEYRNRNPFDLSGGQTQRAAIASVLVMQPDILVLDEPTSQLDPEGSEEVFRVVEKLTGTGITVVMIEQKIEKMAKYCDKLLLLDDGRQIDYDTPEKVLSRPDLEEHGVRSSAFTYITRSLSISNPDGTWPVTLEDTRRLLLESGRNFPKTLLERSTGQDLADKAVDEKVAGKQGQPIFRLSDFSFSYRKENPIFQGLNLSFDLRPTAVIGQNGAGKTTLVKLLKGLLRPVTGKIFFKESDLGGKTVAMLAGQIGYVFQNPDDQIFKYRVLDEVMFGPKNIGMSDAEAKEHALAALSRVGLSDRISENPYDLQLHERKMTAIASVLAMDTDVLILDEPTIAQDVRGREIIGSLIRELSSKGKLVIAILHDMDFVAEYFERVLIMARGRVLADGTPQQVFRKDEALAEARLQRPYTAELCRELGFADDILTVEEFVRRSVLREEGK